MHGWLTRNLPSSLVRLGMADIVLDSVNRVLIALSLHGTATSVHHPARWHASPAHGLGQRSHRLVDEVFA